MTTAPLRAHGDTADATRPPTAAVTFRTYGDLVDHVRAGALGPDPAALRIAVAFTTRQAVRHDGRGTGYRNEVLSLRLAEAVGSCAVEPGELPDSALDDCVGTDLARLLEHPLPPVRVAALDASDARHAAHAGPRGTRGPAGRRLLPGEVQGPREGRRRAARPARRCHGPRGRSRELPSGATAFAWTALCPV